jgi:hypothetical protein
MKLTLGKKRQALALKIGNQGQGHGCILQRRVVIFIAVNYDARHF